MRRVLLFCLLLVQCAAAEKTIVNLKEGEDFVGRYALYQGVTGSGDTQFLVNELSDESPVLIRVVTSDPEKPVNLRLVRENWDRTLKDGTTGEKGEITFGLRASDHVGAVVWAPEPTSYQLFVWVGPKTEWQATPGMVPMAPEEAGETRPDGAESETASQQPAVSASSSDGMDWTGALVASNVLAWCFLGFLFVRTRRSTVVVLMLGLSLVSFQEPVQAQATEEPQEITLKESWDRTRDIVDRLIKLSGGGTGHAPTDSAMKYGNLMLHLAKYVFDYIDPKESATKANFPPPGIPALPSRAMNDPDDKFLKRRGEYQALEADIRKWVELLEKQRAILLEAEFKAKSAEEMGDAVGGMHGLAKLAWIAAKSDPSIAANKKKLYDSYDANFNVLVGRINVSLVKMGRLERTYYGDQDWYYLHGLPYYLYLRERYNRR